MLSVTNVSFQLVLVVVITVWNPAFRSAGFVFSKDKIAYAIFFSLIIIWNKKKGHSKKVTCVFK